MTTIDLSFQVLFDDIRQQNPHLEWSGQQLEELNVKFNMLSSIGVKTLNTLYLLIGDHSAESYTRTTACEILYRLVHDYAGQEYIDRRSAATSLIRAAQDADNQLARYAIRTIGLLQIKRAIPLLISKAQPNNSEEIRQAAIFSLGMYNNVQTTQLLLSFALNHNEKQVWRIYAIQSLENKKNAELTVPPLLKLIFDPTEDPKIRSAAIEAYPDNNSSEALNIFIQLLKDPLPQIRFWTAYALAYRYTDITMALAALNDVMLDDQCYDVHRWSVSREAARAFERIYYQQVVGIKKAFPYSSLWSTYLISPVAEYGEYSQLTYQTDIVVNKQKRYNMTTLQIDPVWFTAQLRAKWPHIRINAREPKPKAYILDWQISIARRKLIGGLHRDGYGIFITGLPEYVSKFAIWYRNIINIQHTLKLYQWAGTGIEIAPDITEELLLKRIT